MLPFPHPEQSTRLTSPGTKTSLLSTLLSAFLVLCSTLFLVGEVASKEDKIHSLEWTGLAKYDEDGSFQKCWLTKDGLFIEESVDRIFAIFFVSPRSRPLGKLDRYNRYLDRDKQGGGVRIAVAELAKQLGLQPLSESTNNTESKTV
jgi:hypothetical protein